MKIQESGEMYLEAILVLAKEREDVRAIDIAGYTGYSKPSVSRALGLLRDSGMIEVAENGFITLTPIGADRALKIYERHNLLAEYFERIGVSQETAELDACRIEHVISDETFEKIKAFAEKLGKR